MCVSVCVCMRACVCVNRFDLKGLSLDAPEDEPGIKKAADNSEL